MTAFKKTQDELEGPLHPSVMTQIGVLLKNRRRCRYVATELRDYFSLDRVRKNWLKVLGVTIVYTMIELPLDLAFNLPAVPWIFLDSVAIAVYVVDIFINFHVMVKNREDEYVKDLARIRRIYLRSWFAVDVLAALPVDYLEFFLMDNNAHAPFQLFRLVKIVRVIRAMKYLDTIDIKGLPAWMQLWFLILIFLIVAHWFACTFWIITVGEGFASGASWVYLEKPVLINGSQLFQYTVCLYWSLATVTTLGYGDITPVTLAETWFVNFAIFFGAAFYAIIIAALGGHIVSTRFAAKTDYSRFMDAVDAFQRYYQLPSSIRYQMNAYYEYLWQRNKSFQDHQILERLPAEIRAAVIDSVFKKLVMKSPTLTVCEDESPSGEFRFLLVSKLHWRAMMVPGEVLFEEGAPVREIFFVRKGRIELRSRASEGLVVWCAEEGAHLGDLGVFANPSAVVLATDFELEGENSTATASAPITAVKARYHHAVTATVRDYAEVFSISVTDFFTLLGEFPREYAVFQQVAIEKRRRIDELMSVYRVYRDEEDRLHREDVERREKKRRAAAEARVSSAPASSSTPEEDTEEGMALSRGVDNNNNNNSSSKKKAKDKKQKTARVGTNEEDDEDNDDDDDESEAENREALEERVRRNKDEFLARWEEFIRLAKDEREMVSAAVEAADVSLGRSPRTRLWGGDDATDHTKTMTEEEVALDNVTRVIRGWWISGRTRVMRAFGMEPVSDTETTTTKTTTTRGGASSGKTTKENKTKMRRRESIGGDGRRLSSLSPRLENSPAVLGGGEGGGGSESYATRRGSVADSPAAPPSRLLYFPAAEENAEEKVRKALVALQGRLDLVEARQEETLTLLRKLTSALVVGGVPSVSATTSQQLSQQQGGEDQVFTLSGGGSLSHRQQRDRLGS